MLVYPPTFHYLFLGLLFPGILEAPARAAVYLLHFRHQSDAASVLSPAQSLLKGGGGAELLPHTSESSILMLTE